MNLQRCLTVLFEERCSVFCLWTPCNNILNEKGSGAPAETGLEALGINSEYCTIFAFTGV